MPRANNSLPVPVSPTMSTVVSRLPATLRARSSASPNVGLEPTMLSRPSGVPCRDAPSVELADGKLAPNAGTMRGGDGFVALAAPSRPFVGASGPLDLEVSSDGKSGMGFGTGSVRYSAAAHAGFTMNRRLSPVAGLAQPTGESRLATAIDSGGIPSLAYAAWACSHAVLARAVSPRAAIASPNSTSTRAPNNRSSL